jgi:hypothetical protein
LRQALQPHNPAARLVQAKKPPRFQSGFSPFNPNYGIDFSACGSVKGLMLAASLSDAPPAARLVQAINTPYSVGQNSPSRKSSFRCRKHRDK